MDGLLKLVGISYNKNMEKYLEELKNLFSRYKEIKLVYLFGSQVTGKTSKLSDYDFAVYFDEKTTSLKRADIKIQLITDLMGILKTNYIDVVSMNDVLDPLLKYEIIFKQKIIYEQQLYRIKIEPVILSQYLDFYTFLDNRAL